MPIKDAQFSQILKEALTVSVRANEKYHCHNGEEVLFGTSQCIKDIELRIIDVVRMRDRTRPMSDKRVHCNGYLKMLRRELQAAQRIASMLEKSLDNTTQE
jgi:hypothetical protein